ncbi:MAG TPA: MFS transporter [Jatrophihabitans sp.]|nr:MFS transporter [Jatrophihabitans sp.]
MSNRAGFRSALRVRDFRALAAARLISMLGDSAAFLAVTVLVYQRTGSSLLSSLTFAISFVPYLFGGSLLSSSIDRFPVRALIIGTDLLGALFVGLLTIPVVPIWLIFLALFAIGIMSPVRSAGIDTVTADLLPGESYVAGRSIQRVISQVSQLVGIGLGGLLIAPFGVRGALGIDVLSFLASALIIRLGTAAYPRRRVEAAATNLATDSLTGLRESWRLAPVRRLLMLGWLVPFVAVWPEALAAPAVADAHRPASLVGIWLTAIPVGMIIGNLGAVWLPGTAWRPRAMYPLALTVPLIMLLFLLQPPFLLALILLALTGLESCYSLELDRRLRDTIPLDLRPRAFALNSTGLMVSQGLGFVAAGAAGQFARPATVIGIGGVIGLAGVVVLWVRARTPNPSRQEKSVLV